MFHCYNWRITRTSNFRPIFLNQIWALYAGMYDVWKYMWQSYKDIYYISIKIYGQIIFEYNLLIHLFKFNGILIYFFKRIDNHFLYQIAAVTLLVPNWIWKNKCFNILNSASLKAGIKKKEEENRNKQCTWNRFTLKKFSGCQIL